MKIILIILLICIILLNKHFFYHSLISNIKILIWFLKIDKKKYIHDRNTIQKYGIQNFFIKRKQILSIGPDLPFFDKQIVSRKNNINELLNYKLYGKTSSLGFIIDSFTTPFNLKGKWIGDSIFRMDKETRGNRKELYLSALSKEKINYYQKLIRYHIPKIFTLQKELNHFETCNKFCITMFFKIHLGIYPDKDDYQDIKTFINALAKFNKGTLFNKPISKQLWNLRFFYEKTYYRIKNIDKSKTCIVNDWIKSGMTVNDVFIEMIHNIVGVVTNWVNTLYPYLIAIYENKIPRIDILNKDKYLHECFRYLLPVKFIASKIKNKDLNISITHDLLVPSRNKSWGEYPYKFNYNRFTNYKNFLTKSHNCPIYQTKKGAKVPKNLSIYENDNYVPFGIGYRRCPGELLSLKLLEEFALYVSNKSLKLYLKNEISKPTHYVFDIIETNYYFVIN